MIKTVHYRLQSTYKKNVPSFRELQASGKIDRPIAENPSRSSSEPHTIQRFNGKNLKNSRKKKLLRGRNGEGYSKHAENLEATKKKINNSDYIKSEELNKTSV